MNDFIRGIEMNFPFLLAAGSAQPKVSLQRAGEALIIAMCTALATSYITVQKLELKQTQLQLQFEEQVKRRDVEVTTIKTDAALAVAKRDAQYEILRNELQKIALNLERMKPRQ